MNIIRIPTPLRTYTGGEKEIQVTGNTVAEAIEALTREHPSVRTHLYDEHDHLRPYVNIFLNDENVRNLKGELTPIKKGDRLMIVPSIAGGFKRSSIAS